MEEFIMDSPPGICSQEDFDHDFSHLVGLIKEGNARLKHYLNYYSYALIKMAIDKGYKINWP